MIMKPLREVVSVRVKPQQKHQKIFFGEYGNFIRTDHVKHPIAKSLKKHSQGNTWFPEEVDYTKDDFDQLSPVAQRMFKLNICYQTLMDSGVDNAYSTVVKRLVTDPIFSIAYSRIAIEETIHAESYSYGLSEIFGSEEAERVLDMVYEDPFVRDRMVSEVDGFAVAEDICLNQGRTDLEAKKAIFVMLLRTYLLEAVKFPFSFFVTFAINKSSNSAIQGVTRMIKLIAYDELTFHVPVNKAVMKILHKDPSEDFQELFLSGWAQETTIEVLRETVESELSWGRHLLLEGDIPGFNIGIATHFIKYHAMLAIKNLGFVDKDAIPYHEDKSDIIDGFNNYKDIQIQNTAGQEAENSSYQKGALNNDLHKYEDSKPVMDLDSSFCPTA